MVLSSSAIRRRKHMDLINAVGEEPESADRMLVVFGVWLARQRGLSPVTVKNYCSQVGQFLAMLPDPASVSFGVVKAGTVTTFMVEYCRDRNTNSAKSILPEIRARHSVGCWKPPGS